MAKKMPDFSPIHLGGARSDGPHDFRPKPVDANPKSAPEPVDSPTHPSESEKKEPVKKGAKAGKSGESELAQSASTKTSPQRGGKRLPPGEILS